MSLFKELNDMLSPMNIESRGENAWGVAVKFLRLLERSIPEDDERRRLMGAWMKSVKENDYKKFKRALNKYKRNRREKESNNE